MLGEDSITQQIEPLRDVEMTASNGRALFTDSDQFYASLSSVTSNAVSLVSTYNVEGSGIPLSRPGVIVLPVIVVEGELLASHLDQTLHEVTVQSVNYARVLWGDAPRTAGISCVEIVPASSPDTFASERYASAEALLNRMESASG
ncbi:MAG: hypothetical protein EXR43_01250 [Dehalococcoidia bacterium]|nr:hypothetical protein [Dehalococcoidia bacterium]